MNRQGKRMKDSVMKKCGFMKRRAWFCVAIGLAMVVPLAGQEEAAPDNDLRLKFNEAPITFLLDAVSEQTGRTLLLSPGLPTANVTLRSRGALSLDEYLGAIEAVLGMNGIALVMEGERFIRVVPSDKAREEHLAILPFEAAKELEKSDAVVSQLISVKHIELSEAEAAVLPLLHNGRGSIHRFEGINTLMVTDTASNIKRVLEIVSLIDQSIEAREVPHVIDIRYAKAADIKAKLEEIIADQEERQKQRSTVPRQRDTGQPGVVTPPSSPAGVIRARQVALRRARQAEAAARAAEEETTAPEGSEAERGIIRGKVKIIVDERTNKLIIITRPENIPFFEKIIDVLDVETSPDVIVQVFRLEYATASDIEGMLNELIGAASEDEAVAGSGNEGGDQAAAGEGRSQQLRDYVARRDRPAQPSTQAGGSVGARVTKSKVGQLSTDNIKILSDERTNSLIIMAPKSDIAALADIIADMDMMLQEVLVEAVILEVSLDDSVETGIDWIQSALLRYEEGPGGSRRPRVGFAGRGGGGSLSPVDALTFAAPSDFGSPAAGLTYYFTMFDLNINAVVQALASDSRTEILSSPVIRTTDNKQATIDVSRDAYFFTGTRPVTSGNQIEFVEDVQREQVGIELQVTPRINEKKYVVMELVQSIENISGVQVINENEWPVTTTRKFESTLSVRSGETIVLGGLVITEDRKSRSKIPILGDIPLLGLPFRSDRKNKVRNEVVVFLTPYVLETPEEGYADARRRRNAIGSSSMWERGWSDSHLAHPERLDNMGLNEEGEIVGRAEVGASDATEEGKEPVDAAVPLTAEMAPKMRVEDPVLPAALREGAIREVPLSDGDETERPDAGTAIADDGPGPEDAVEDRDPWSGVDKEVRRYVERTERRYRGTLKKVDRELDRELDARP